MEYNFYALCRNVGIRAETFLQNELSDLDLTPAQANLLLLICNEYPQGTTVTELHAKMGITKSSLSSLIKALKQKGYLRAAAHRADDRIKILLPTEKLLAIRDRLQGAEDSLRLAMQETIGEEKLEKMYETLQELCKESKTTEKELRKK